MRSNCICDSAKGVVCASHSYLRSLELICLRCGHRRGDHTDPRLNSTACLIDGGCAAKCDSFVTLGDIEQGPRPPTEEAIIEARDNARRMLRCANRASATNDVIDEALEAVAEFVRMRNG